MRPERGQDRARPGGVGKVAVRRLRPGQQARRGGQVRQQGRGRRDGETLGLESGDDGAQQAIVALGHGGHEVGKQAFRRGVEPCGVECGTGEAAGKDDAGDAVVLQVVEKLAEPFKRTPPAIGLGRGINRHPREADAKRAGVLRRDGQRQGALPCENREHRPSARRQVSAGRVAARTKSTISRT